MSSNCRFPARTLETIIVALTICLVTACGGPAPEEVKRADDVVLRDDNGTVRIRMGVGDDGVAFLSLFDGQGQSGVGLSVASDGATDIVLAQAGRDRIALRAGTGGEAKLLLMNDRGVPRIEIGCSDANSSYGIDLYRGIGQPAATLRVWLGEGGPSVLGLNGRDGTERVVATSSLGDKRGSLSIRDESGKILFKSP